MHLAIAQKNWVVQLLPKCVGDRKYTKVGAERKSKSKTEWRVVGISTRIVLVPRLIVESEHM